MKEDEDEERDDGSRDDDDDDDDNEDPFVDNLISQIDDLRNKVTNQSQNRKKKLKKKNSGWNRKRQKLLWNQKFDLK